MNISSVNSKKDLNFKQIYRVQVKKGFWGMPDGLRRSFGTFGGAVEEMINQSVNSRFKELSNLPSKDIINRINQTFKINRNKYYTLLLESPVFTVFQKAAEAYGHDINWVSNHIGMENPSQMRENYDTFLIYTAKEAKYLRKIMTKREYYKIALLNRPQINKAINDGRCNQRGIKILEKIFYAQKLSDKINKKFADRNIEEITLNNREDLILLFKRIDESMPKIEVA